MLLQYISLLLCAFYCASGSFVPYWIIELSPVDHVQSMMYRDFVLQRVTAKLALLNFGQIGSLSNVYEFYYPHGERGVEYSLISKELQKIDIMARVEQQKILPYKFRDYHLPTDPQFKNQWPWFNTGQTGGPSGLDINVVPVWIQGVTGSGSTVAVIDDGVQVTHPDLDDNIDLSISFSFIRNSNNPSPFLSESEYSHGTNCAGEIIMITDNSICGTGVAYNAKLGGIQFLLSDFRPSQQATALHYMSDTIQIYSNSYGPTDDGFTVGGPSIDSVSAINLAINQGRDRLGNIYVFSSGNGGKNGDSCASDGFVNNRHIIGVGSADQTGEQAYYDESCSGKMATTYTFNGNVQGNDVVTTFVSNECFSNFTGTSASAPLVSGVIALAFEVNGNLSWRDVQYLIAYTSDSSQLIGDFVKNGGGLIVSSQFGFGAINAEAYVNRARQWVPVDEAIDTYRVIFDSEVLVNESHPYRIDIPILSTPIAYLEHVIFTVTFDVQLNSTDSKCYEHDDYFIDPLVINQRGARRGDAQITACSPFGTCSVLLPKRPMDFVNCEGYDNWDFMSVHFWAENPIGNWSFHMAFDSQSGGSILKYISVALYGVSEKQKSIPVACDSTCKHPTGCSPGVGSTYCDSCADGYYRNITTMECVSACSPGACVLAGTCVVYDGSCPEFSSTSKRYDSIIIGASVGFITIVIFLILLIFCCCFLRPTKTKEKRSVNSSRIESEDTEYFLYNDRK